MEEEGRQRAQDALELTRRQEEDDAMRRAHAGAHYFLNRCSYLTLLIPLQQAAARRIRSLRWPRKGIEALE